MHVKPTAAMLNQTLKNSRIIKNGKLTSLKQSLLNEYQSQLKNTGKGYSQLLREGRFGGSIDRIIGL